MSKRRKFVHSLAAVQDLPEHKRVLEAILNHFDKEPGVVAAFLSGSTATGGMDDFSDIDLGIVCDNEETMEGLWEERWNWDFLSWGHRFDADHIKPHFVIYLFETKAEFSAPLIKADIAFYTPSHLPPKEGAPFRVVWDDTGKLSAWSEQMNGSPAASVNWDNLNHEDERFWAWLVYLLLHAHRGECFEAAESVTMVRNVTMAWYARLQGEAYFNSRRLEERTDAALMKRFNGTFPQPSKSSISEVCLALIELHEDLRLQVTKSLGAVKWKTSTEFCTKVKKMASELGKEL